MGDGGRAGDDGEGGRKRWGGKRRRTTSRWEGRLVVLSFLKICGKFIFFSDIWFQWTLELFSEPQGHFGR